MARALRKTLARSWYCVAFPPFLVMFLLLSREVAAVNMCRIAILPHALGFTYPCGDADHDGRERAEVYGTRSGSGIDSLVVFEHEGHNAFTRSTTRAQVECSWAFGDGDDDSLSELVVCVPESTSICIYESPTRDSYPSECVWYRIFPGVAGYLYTQYTDLDRDGHQEIAVRVEGEGIQLFENAGNDTYYLAATLPSVNGSFGEFAVGDFDRDSLMELVGGSSQHNLWVYEATGIDNQYVLSATCSTETFCNYSVAAAPDMDGDNMPEFIALGRVWGADYPAKVMVYEATAHQQYRRVWEAPSSVGLFYSISTGDVDGDKVDEFATASAGHVRLYKCTGPDQYELVWTFDSCNTYVRLFDINGDDRAEVIFDNRNNCVIYEDTSGLGMAEFSGPAKSPLPVASPAVVSLGTPARFSSLPASAHVAVLDATGRLVRQQVLVRQREWTWDLRNDAGQLVAPGTYFVRVSSATQTNQLKLVVVN